MANPVYRVTLAGDLWEVMRPLGSIPHAFFTLDEALSFVRDDSRGRAEIVEVVIGSTYMVKQLAP